MADLSRSFELAADWIRGADALIIGAGAGIGVDSGLPDFRGDEGFWKAYPPFRDRGLSFVDMANPRWFRTDPAQAWGFYGHRLNLYRKTEPHVGFQRLLEWGKAKKHGYFVFTSNVDGQFQKAGFDPKLLAECHGSIHHFQCISDCSAEIWSAEGIQVSIDPVTYTATEELPHCRYCRRLARPNILMFGDGAWNPGLTDRQDKALDAWLEKNDGCKIVAIECGAGRAIPSVRHFCERRGQRLIRINPREPKVRPGHLSLPCGALEALQGIAEAL
jgi:NAD-dependent SIR2 family protein deacetylase